MGKIIQLLTHPCELGAVIRLLGFRKPLHPRNPDNESKSLQSCYALLKLTSRSFAAVIEELNPELRDAVMLFYLVLRALDTVEDDMTLDPTFKVDLLRKFDSKLDTTDWTFTGSGPNEKDRVVLVKFDDILTEYHKLKPEYQEIIKDITKKMGNGMADYILDEEFNLSGVSTIKEYDLYCHYVAGLVGEGLTKLMVLAKFLDDLLVADNFVKSNLMGLFLQKTNIIRDYHEDLLDGRSFWPKEIWAQYTDSLPLFHREPLDQQRGLQCISHLVRNALNHVTDVLTFLLMVKDPSTFNFCAIPQVMAIATLALVYNNPRVLHGNVKLRKGTTCSLMLESRTFPGVVAIFKRYAREIHQKSDVNDPNYLHVGVQCAAIEKFCDLMYPPAGSIPDGLVKQEKSINKAVAARKLIDEGVQKQIDEEGRRFYGLLTAIAVVIVSVVVLVK